MKYNEKAYKMKKESKANAAGCVKQASEENYAMLDNGGGKYSYNNPMELKQKADKLAKVLDKKGY